MHACAQIPRHCKKSSNPLARYILKPAKSILMKLSLGLTETAVRIFLKENYFCQKQCDNIQETENN
jgi:hypothetical protein